MELLRLFSPRVLSAIPLIVLLTGCTPATPHASAPDGADEKAVRDIVVAFQLALQARDAEKLWSLLDSESKADAERAAKAIRDRYGKANPEERAEQEKALGLPATELAALTGTGFLKTKRFHGKYHEVPDSTIDKVTPQGDTATVNYTEADGDHEHLTLVRQEGRWKLSLPMPK
jgi:hypothetical protein